MTKNPYPARRVSSRVPRALLALLLVAVPLSFSPLAAAQDDAGSGADAPDAIGQAADVPFGAHAGQLHWSAGDAGDAYRVTPDGCQGMVLAYSVGSDRRAFRVDVYDAQGTRIGPEAQNGLARAVSKGPFLVLFTTTGWGSDLGPLAYEFRVGALPPQDDAGTGCDAPGHRAEAVTLADGKHAGVLDPAQGDVADWYRLPVGPCDAAVLVVESTGYVTVDVHDEGGALLASANATTRVLPTSLPVPGHVDLPMPHPVATFVLTGGPFTLDVRKPSPLASPPTPPSSYVVALARAPGDCAAGTSVVVV